MFVKHRFQLAEETTDLLRVMTPKFGFNGFGEFIFNRTYSREICEKCRSGIKYGLVDNQGHQRPQPQDYCPIHGFDFQYGQETWADVIIRVTNGTFSIRKDWYLRNHIAWDESFWQHYAKHFAISAFLMEWMPPGRGLWAMGTDYVYERGSMALQNCGFTLIGDHIGTDINWTMDALMNGVGVGFTPVRDDSLKVHVPRGTYDFVIPDSREGWCEATELLINAYIYPGQQKPRLIYDKVRPAGQPIRGFGGISSGPEPLMLLHQQIENFVDMFGTTSWYDSVLFKTDLANAVGCCVISGNVRRSAELCAGPIDDVINLKNYEKYPYRETHGYMSNNSVLLKESEDFQRLDEVAERILTNGEPGIINCRNLPFGRIGKSMDGLRLDKAIGFNPCGEQPLEDKELCTLVESCPTMCINEQGWYKALEYATLYASTVTLLPTHRPETNAVMLRNRRIGVGIIDVAGWQQQIGTTNLTKYLRHGYGVVRRTNQWVNNEAGIPEAIRVTTVKPGGTGPKLPGLRSGWSWPTFGLTLRRVRVARNQAIHAILTAAGIPHEPDVFSANTDVFEWPIDQSDGDRVRSATEVSLWEQAMTLVLMQREWSDNAVSNTLYFKPKWNLIKDINLGHSFHVMDFTQHVLTEIYSVLTIDWDEFLEVQEYEAGDLRYVLNQDIYSDDWHLKVYRYDPNHEENSVEHVLAAIAPLIKSASVLPHCVVGVYRQMPEEGITREEYNRRLSTMKPIDWSKLRRSDGIDEKYCEGPSCELRRN